MKEMVLKGLRNPTVQDPIARALVLIAIISTAFNDLTPVLPVGELQSDAFVYIFIIMLIYLFRNPQEIVLPTSFVMLIAAFGVCIVIGVALNYPAISTAYFKTRSGFSRVITQGMVLMLGLMITLMFYDLARRGFVPVISKGARLAIFVMTFFGVLEIGSWFSIPGLSQVHEVLGGLIHGGTGLPYAQRLRMTAFEVSWAAVMLTFFFPFGMIGIRPGDWRLPVYMVLILTLTVLTQSRTALLVIVAQIILMLWKILSRRVDYVIFTGLAMMMLVAALMMNPSGSQKISETISNLVTHGRLGGPSSEDETENMSNVTRFSSIRAGFSMFRDHPIFGVGLGQYGFHYTKYLHAEDFRSYEVRDLYSVDSLPDDWPPTYSLHARMLSELGLFGYVIFLAMIVPVLINSLRYSNPGNETGRVHLAVAMTLFGWLLLGASIDTFRFYGGWIAIGIGFSLYAAKRTPRSVAPAIP